MVSNFCNDTTTSYTDRGRIQVDWPAYNSANGETWPAISEVTVNLSAESTFVVTSEKQRGIITKLKVLSSTVQGPPINLAEVGALVSPSGRTIDASLVLPKDTVFYEDLPQDDTYYLGSTVVDSSDSPEELFLPVVTVQ